MEGLDASPVQLLFGRRTRYLLPQHTSLLQPTRLRILPLSVPRLSSSKSVTMTSMQFQSHCRIYLLEVYCACVYLIKAHGQLESVQRRFRTVHIMSLQMVLLTGETVVICLSYQQTNQSLPLLKYPRNLPT